jgi:peptidoglycan/LPS O-acetylase OafA/YrhL
VGLFLLISGLLIPLSLTRMGGLRFAVSRVFRIYPTYWAGLAVTLIALWIAAWLADNDFDITRRDVIGHVSIAFQDMLGGAISTR